MLLPLPGARHPVGRRLGDRVRGLVEGGFTGMRRFSERDLVVVLRWH